jgi:Do/DeqQ family serine protease
MNKKQVLWAMLGSSVLGGLFVLLGIGLLSSGGNSASGFTYNGGNGMATTFAKMGDTPRNYIVPEGVNFITASRKIVPAVVHITNRSKVDYTSSSWRRMFRGDNQYRQSTGSGVLISADGYIATNYHVVDDADELEVRLDDNRRLKAELIGVDPDTDLALIKVKTTDLAYVEFGNSDDVEIGEWVLAVGNPFDLNNTVTAGIISAKARNIHLLTNSENRYGIESFLQTDAVVNRGNSGGALVNLNGDLIGINTAIATTTGTFSGYSFAVPSILVKKVMDDLLEFGEVRRGLLGVTIRDADGQETEELSGVRIMGISPGGAADIAGLKEEDVIVGVDGVEVKTTSQLQELIARRRPGDNVAIGFKRNGAVNNTKLILQKRELLVPVNGEEPEILIEETPITYEISGATFKSLSQQLKRTLRLTDGVQVDKVEDGAWKNSGLKEGFIITKVGEEEIKNIEQFQKIIDAKTKDFLVMGKYPDGSKDYFRIRW